MASPGSLGDERFQPSNRRTQPRPYGGADLTCTIRSREADTQSSEYLLAFPSGLGAILVEYYPGVVCAETEVVSLP